VIISVALDQRYPRSIIPAFRQFFIFHYAVFLNLQGFENLEGLDLKVWI